MKVEVRNVVNESTCEMERSVLEVNKSFEAGNDV
jgi:hypothetical protein